MNSHVLTTQPACPMKRLLAIVALLHSLLAVSVPVSAEMVVIREIMYHPQSVAEGEARLPEFVEIENITSTVFDIAEWELTGGVSYTFPKFDAGNPTSSFLMGRQRIVVCEGDPEVFREAYGISPSVRVLGPWTGSLDNAGERVTLRNKNGVVKASVRYDDEHPWPVAPDGAGHSLVLVDTERAIDDYRRWGTSSRVGGNPGVSDGAVISPLAINEVHFDQDGDVDWIEIYNGAATPQSVDGYFLSGARGFGDQVAISGSVPAEGYLSFDVSFSNNSVAFLVDENSVVRSAVNYDRDTGREHVAAYPDGSTDFYSSAAGSRNQANNPDRETGVVINELMVEPPSNHRDGEFIELYNRGSADVSLTGWEFTEGVSFRFPPGSIIAAGEYVVIAANEKVTRAAFPQANIIGQYSGNLSNNNELLRIEDSWGNLVDEVHYHTGGDWPVKAGGLGSSMELRHPDMNNDFPTAWADSDESEKGEWTSFTIADRYNQLRTMGGESSWKELHMHGVGDCQVAFRDLDFSTSGGSNLLPGNGRRVSNNGNGATGWLCQGTHHLSHMQGQEFHLVSTGHGDIKANRVEIDVVGLQRNDALTFEGQARWVYGKPTVIVHTWDRSFGGVLRLPVPRNLGTAGAANSALLASGVPVLSELKHSPAVPRPGVDVTITVRVDSPASPNVNLRHRPDFNSTSAETAWLTTPMVDNGTSGDQRAGDGIYTAVLDQYASEGQIAQFYVEADAGGGDSTIMPSPAPEKPAMFIIDSTNPGRDLRSQRFIVSARSMDALSTNRGQSTTFNYAFPRLSNQYFNCTYIANERHIIYNCEIRKSGSPWTRSDGNSISKGKWKTPRDKRYRGWTRRTIDNDGAGGQGQSHNNRIIRYWLYLLGHASNLNEFTRVVVNNGSPQIREDVETNANDFLKRNWENGEKGELYRIDDEWWFDDNWSRQQRNADWSVDGRSVEPNMYHAEWMKRSREEEYDYGSFINWVFSVGQNRFTREEIYRMSDVDMMAANAVVRGWVDDWDTLTRNRGKNGYFLRRYSDGKWMLLQWDSDLTFGNSSAPFIGGLAGVPNYFRKPYVEQRVNYYIGEMVEKYTKDSERLKTWFDLEVRSNRRVSINPAIYYNFNNSRVNYAMNSEIGGAVSNTPFRVSGPATTSGNTIDLTGSSNHRAFDIRVVGHPEAEVVFTTQTEWEVTGLYLREGRNNLEFEALDSEGLVVATDSFSVTKTGNAPPVVEIDTNPDSLNVAAHQILTVDASSSFDPEGDGLSFDWQVDGGAIISHYAPDQAGIQFPGPGLYLLTLTVEDEGGNQTVETRQIPVYAESGWHSFSDKTLADGWTEQNVEVRHDHSGDAWYTLDDLPGELVLKLNDTVAKGMRAASPAYPALWRDVPASADTMLQTDVRLSSIQQGGFIAGLILKAREDGEETIYALGMENGDFLRVKKVVGTTETRLAAIPWGKESAVVRIRRAGNDLHFDYRTSPGLWESLHVVGMPAESTLSQAGLFASSQAPIMARFEFDYFMVVDESAVSPSVDSLRITEVMYNPLEVENGVDLEFIELMNTGNSSINLAQVKFQDGDPFAELVFGDEDLSPGEVAVVVADVADFQSIYGQHIRILGTWADGSLRNSGEVIVLSDPLGNIIHDFEYSDGPPWPAEADGNGPSLEVIDTEGNYNDPFNWRASLIVGGTPGEVFLGDLDDDGLDDSEEGVLGTDPLNPDSDGDGTLDGAEVAAGTDPLDRASAFRLVELLRSGDTTRATWSSVPGRRYTLQVSEDLAPGSWTDVATVDATGATTTVPHDVAGAGALYYRVSVE